MNWEGSSDTSPVTSPGTGGLPPAEAFAALGNERRIEILQAVWEAPDNELRFSEIMDQVDITDNGKLRYHLNQLTNHFLWHPSEGKYVLSEAGKQVIRAVLAGSVTEDPTLEPVELDRPCPICDAPLKIGYAGEHLTIGCTSCEGLTPGDYPTGIISMYYPPAGLRNHDPDDLVSAGLAWFWSRIIPMIDGICPHCAGQTVLEIHICNQHVVDDGLVCDHCTTPYMIWTEYLCSNCGFSRSVPLSVHFTQNVDALAFYNDHGIDQETLKFDLPTPLLADYEEEIVSHDPLRFKAIIGLDGDELEITFDDSATIVGTRRVDSPGQGSRT